MSKTYTTRPRSPGARKAWDALVQKTENMFQIYYDRKQQVWVGVGKKYMGVIRYWPRVPMARLSSEDT